MIKRMNQKGVARLLIVVIVALIILLIPIPYYQGKVLCLPGITCPKEGWYLGNPLWERIFHYFYSINRPIEYTTRITSPSP